MSVPPCKKKKGEVILLKIRIIKKSGLPPPFNPAREKKLGRRKERGPFS